MKRSSAMVPIVIMAILITVATSVILVKNTAPEMLSGYDVLGFGNLKITDDFKVDSFKNDDVISSKETEEDSLGETAIDSINVLDAIVEQNAVNSGIQEQKKEFLFDTAYIETVAPGRESSGFEFFTSSSNNDYRVNLKTKISDKPLYGTVYISIYDERGIVVEKQNVSPAYYDSQNYKDEFNVDFHLDKSKKYTLKVSGDKLDGDYQLIISEIPRDAGYSEETATPINLGDEITANANSAISDWYVFTAPESRKFQIDFHNINTGARINISGNCENTSLFSMSVKNENGEQGTFFAREGAKVLIEVAPQNEMVDGNYIMSISKYE